MKTILYLALAALVVAGCSAKDNGVRVSANKPEAAAPVAPQGRTEPIFYNGKTYTLKFAPGANGVYSLAVLGMTAKQQKDATNVGTSAIRYFACPDGKTGKVVAQPRYVNNAWNMTARCG